MNGNQIERVTEFNFLGLVLQSNLSWNKHINHISLKVSKAIGIIYRLKSVYPLAVLLTLYNTLVLPYFNYCILSWGSKIKENHQLYLLQKKAVRIIFFFFFFIQHFYSALFINKYALMRYA